jgi:hypothetical protein
MFLFRKSFLEKMDKHRKRFFWQKKKGKRVITWLNGAKFVGQKRKVALGLKIYEDRISAS